jgi:hypothetical protein
VIWEIILRFFLSGNCVAGVVEEVRIQLATYPQSPFSGPVRCCEVTNLYQAFRAAHRPGAIMDKSGAGLVFAESKNHKDFQLQLRYLNQGNQSLPARFLNAFAELDAHNSASYLQTG